MSEEAVLHEEQPVAAAEAVAKKAHLPEIPVTSPVTITSQDELDQVLKAHQRWVDEVLNPSVEVARGRANLEGADLRGYDLAGVNLSGANLAHANLEGVNLEGAILTVANLQKANLRGAKLAGVRMPRAKVDGADFRSADLTAAIVTGVDFSKCLLKEVAETAESESGASTTSTDNL